MTTREKALLASSPGLTVLVLGLAWWAIDRHGLDLAIRWLDDHARL
jgi:hypothetical protein